VLQQDLAEINAGSTALGSKALSYLRTKLAQSEPQLDSWLNAVAALAALFVLTGVPMIWLSPALGFYFDLVWSFRFLDFFCFFSSLKIA